MGDIQEHQFGDLTVRIDQSQCIGTGNCMKLAGDVFEFDNDTLCRFKSSPGAIDRERLIEACRVCPVEALFVFEADRRQIVP